MKKKFRLFYSTTSNLIFAKKISKILIKNKKAICVNLINDVQSFYTEDGKIKNTKEIILIIKTACLKMEIENFLSSVHNYEIPIILEIKNSPPNKKYLDWFVDNSK